MQLHTLDWIIVIASLLICFAPALFFSKRASKNTSKFFASGCSAPWWLAGISMVATTFSSDTPNWVTQQVLPVRRRRQLAMVGVCADGEFYCKMFTNAGHLPTACLRYFNVFGPRQDPKSQYAAVPIFIDRAVRHEPITIHGDGEQTRDFIYVKDIAATNVFFATRSTATGVFNVAYGQRIIIKELATVICRLTISRSEIIYTPIPTR